MLTERNSILEETAAIEHNIAKLTILEEERIKDVPMMTKPEPGKRYNQLV